MTRKSKKTKKSRNKKSRSKSPLPPFEILLNPHNISIAPTGKLIDPQLKSKVMNKVYLKGIFNDKINSKTTRARDIQRRESSSFAMPLSQISGSQQDSLSVAKRDSLPQINGQ